MKQTFQNQITIPYLIRFTLPTIIMMIFLSMYTIVDGIFVSRMVGTDALSAVNIVYPLMSIVLAVGIMYGTGASAVIAKKFGEQKNKEANQNFTFIILVGFVTGIVMLLLLFVFLDPILKLLGANEAIFHYCYAYTKPLMFFLPMSILQLMFQFLFVTAGKPSLGLILTIFGGAANIILDYLFIGPLGMGVAGAAIATGIGYCIPSVYGLIYFTVRRKNLMRFVRPKWDGKVLLKTCTNGSSEMVSNLSAAVITFLFNLVMMRYLGENGVAAITIVLYSDFLILAVFLGYSSGVAPLISYHYGDGNREALQKIFRISMIFIGVGSVIMFLASLLLAKPIVGVFSPNGTDVYALAVKGFYLYAICYLFKGINVFASSMFTAFSDGKVSAILSFLRTLLFLVLSIVILTLLFEVDGVWISVPVAEFLGLLVAILYLVRLRHVYHYTK